MNLFFLAQVFVCETLMGKTFHYSSYLFTDLISCSLELGIVGMMFVDLHRPRNKFFFIFYELLLFTEKEKESGWRGFSLELKFVEMLVCFLPPEKQ